jgi:hypothetical protein
MKGALIVLLFTGQTALVPFDYEPKDYDGSKGFTDTEIVLSCGDRAESLYPEIAEHHWSKDGKPNSQGWYLKDGTGTLQGHIC